MNYAWANPTTGLREQTQHATPTVPLALLEEQARRRTWLEVNEPGCKEAGVNVYRQEVFGQVTAEGDHVELPPGIPPGEAANEYPQFAWAHPVTGIRQFSDSWPSFLKDEIAGQDNVSAVVIYGQKFAFQVTYVDPEPPEPAPVVPTATPASSTALDTLREQVENFVDLDNSNPAPKATALALIDIAQSLRMLLGRGNADVDRIHAPVPRCRWSLYLAAR